MRKPPTNSDHLFAEERLVLGVDEAFALLSESAADEPLRICVVDPDGVVWGSICGSVAVPNRILTEDGEVFVEWFATEGHMGTRIRAPLSPDVVCTIDRAGTFVAKLPGGAAWSVASFKH